MLTADSIAGLETLLSLPAGRLRAEIAAIRPLQSDRFGRVFGATALAPPYRAVRVTGALFHTQGGLVVDARARVRLAAGGACSNLFAAGGAACGV